jgi:hypothetical protein
MTISSKSRHSCAVRRTDLLPKMGNGRPVSAARYFLDTRITLWC